MLKSIKTQNFRLFKDLSIEGLSRVNLIVGKNNIGKSTLLEAIQLLTSQDKPYTLIQLMDERGEFSIPTIDESDIPRRGSARVYEISHLFSEHQLERNSTLQLEADGLEHLSLKISIVHSELKQMSLFGDEPENHPYLRLTYGEINEEFNLDIFGRLISEDKRLLLSRALSRTKTIYITTKGFDYRILSKLWDNINLTPKEADIIKMLQILDPKVERVGFQSHPTANSGILVKHVNREQPLPLGSMGDGMHRILAIAIALANSENGYLLIDEIDTGLHYQTITDLWNVVFETAERLNVQVFATTHSNDCVRSFAEALSLRTDSDVGAYFRLQRRKDQIQAERYDPKRLIFATTQEVEIR